jgi:hypothetical protein
MEAYSRPATLEDLKALVRTVNLEGLLRTKQTPRDKDAADRIVLEQALTAWRQRSRE